MAETGYMCALTSVLSRVQSRLYMLLSPELYMGKVSLWGDTSVTDSVGGSDQWVISG